MRILFCLLLTFIADYTMSGEKEREEIDIKLFMKAVNDQFMRLNTRLDELQYPSTSKSTRRRMIEEELDDQSDYEEPRAKRGEKGFSKRDDNLGSIKMKITVF